ncbi:OmpW/AlkL family protein [Aquabacterium sp.]|uniref:OmpW/AlkL family protein n=1 Tax=Aquabacterium sp. TaxID=1872578 RepID=UPI002C383F5F|nr:OmpW family outer membrane protein [Aquabacterium sp.]HSW04997.1 OmpW family outer membrane protein [Aquabacterium sp.]
MRNKVQGLAAAVGLALLCTMAQAQENTIKIGVTRYDTHAKTSGISGIGVPAGADAEVGDATTAIFVYERLVSPNFGIELVLGVPPKITSRASGTVAFLGEVLSARNVAPTLLFNYHFGQPGDTLRPYLGAGINYTRFVDIKSSLASDVQMSDSVGLAVHAGIDYALNKQWGLFASVSALKVKSDLVASGSTVLTTTIDFKPIVYSMGASYRF